MGGIDYKEKYLALQRELKEIKSIHPEDNLNYLSNQIRCGNLKTSGDKIVLSIIAKAIDGIKNLNKRLNKDKSKHLATKNNNKK